MATKEARELAEDFKIELHKSHPIESDVLVPNCIYRAGCPEFKTCGYLVGFNKWLKENDKALDWTNIQQRYDLYNEYFYSKTKCDKVGFCREKKSCGRKPKKNWLNLGSIDSENGGIEKWKKRKYLNNF